MSINFPDIFKADDDDDFVVVVANDAGEEEEEEEEEKAVTICELQANNKAKSVMGISWGRRNVIVYGCWSSGGVFVSTDGCLSFVFAS